MSDKYGYIGIETLLNFCCNNKDHCVTPNDFMRMNRVKIDDRPHGEWVLDKEFSFVFNMYECSKCRFYGSRRWKFCPSCGAEMRVKNELNRVSKELNSEIEKSKSEICPCIECCKLDNSEPCKKGCSDYQRWKEGES